MALVGNIQHLSTSDGPGIRSTVFLMGCGLKCAWCHNPENLSGKPVLGVDRLKCIGCGNCIHFCSAQALSLVNNKISINRKLCDNCGRCVSECYQKALLYCGINYTSEEVVELLRPYFPYYRHSGGGVTLSGGEPLLQRSFVCEVVSRLKAEGIDVIVETALFCDLDEDLMDALKECSAILVDLKFYDSGLHKKWTGQGNELIISNINRLNNAGVGMQIRTPVVPGVNDNIEELSLISAFAHSLSQVEAYSLIPYHPLGLSKYEEFGVPIQFDYRSCIDPQKIKDLEKTVSWKESR